jgi:hypothetical protein
MNTNDNYTGLRATIRAGTKYHTVDENNVLSPEFILDHDVEARPMFLEQEWEVYFVPELDAHLFIRPDDYAQNS